MLFRTVGKVFRPLESRIIRRQGQPHRPPLFIVGPARSGTTLIYQSIAYSLDVCYLSNVMVAFPDCPALVAKLVSYINGCDAPRSFSSHYGKTEGWRSPAQGYQIWSRWFPKEGEGTQDKDWTEYEKNELAGMVTFIEKVYNAPFLNKWPGFSVNILKLIEALPGAMFIRVQRDPMQTAQSILKGRRELTGDPNISISRVPNNYSNYMGRSYIEQVCAYLRGVEIQLDQESRKIGEEKFLTVRYENFCVAPQEELKKIIDWYYQVAECKLKVLSLDLPAFEISTAQKVTPVEADALQECLLSLNN